MRDRALCHYDNYVIKLFKFLAGFRKKTGFFCAKNSVFYSNIPQYFRLSLSLRYFLWYTHSVWNYKEGRKL